MAANEETWLSTRGSTRPRHSRLSRLLPAALDPKRSFRLRLAGLLLLSATVAFYGLGSYGIINGNESLYVESAREMLRSGNFAIPTLDGLPYLEKPPLFVWLIAAASSIFGTSELAARSTTALATMALVISTSAFAKRLGIGATGVGAGLILLTSLGIDIMSRVAMPDLLLTALFGAACCSFLLAVRHRSVASIRGCAAILGAATMVKGPLTIALFVMIAGAYFWRQSSRRRDILAVVRDPWAALLLLTPMALWLVAIDLRQPGAAWYFIVNEQVLRFLGLRQPHDYYSGSVFYYFPRLFLFFFPWVGVLVFGWLVSRKQPDSSKEEARRFLWLCVWIPFSFFSLSSAKANYYVVLCLPAMALLAADYLPTLLRDSNRGILTLSVATPVLLLIGLWTFRLLALSSGRARHLFPNQDGTVPLTIASLSIIALITVSLLQFGWRRAAVLCLGALIIPLSLEFDHIIARAEPLMSARTLAMYVRTRFPGAPVLLFQDFESFGALPVYLGHEVPVIDSQSADLYFGKRLHPHHVMLLTEDQALASGPRTLIVVMNDRERAFTATRIERHVTRVTTIGRATLYQIVR
ncbi:undecaprenyl phosphate-alpha-4-amino-4-deoxy-L-arabinose arabinosyl transferase [mine drainage metagenome]|uniref:Undecaprenyl phosphate-alpha-4-amino-4-deoxy-L-arabinose arabinosyl transferase n=1 Tax=mine drainage metagenome TaxID=410659 RepID=A0A1J5SS30_9ZZZZ